jgi:UDP-N-acetylmuramate dehydrogenase
MSSAPEPAAAAALELALGAGRLRRREPLAPYTTFRVGGPADLFYTARTPAELACAVGAARAHGVPFFLLGLGANILVGDRGFRGLVIRNHAEPDAAVTLLSGHRLRAASGAVVWPDLIERAVARGLSGLEHYAGIPSTVGGAMWQNLHFLSPAPERARTMFIAEVTECAELLGPDGARRTASVEELELGYDTSILHHRPDIVLTATFRLAPADPARLRQVIRENLAWRADRHPPLDAEPSAGSIFKKIQGIGAGRLIEECGLKGARIGQAEVTHRHANILINRGGATAADVRALIAHIQDVVARRTGYVLEPEVGFVGEFA